MMFSQRLSRYSVIVPCKPSHPDIEMSLMIDKDVKVSRDNTLHHIITSAIIKPRLGNKQRRTGCTTPMLASTSRTIFLTVRPAPTRQSTAVWLAIRRALKLIHLSTSGSHSNRVFSLQTKFSTRQCLKRTEKFYLFICSYIFGLGSVDSDANQASCGEHTFPAKLLHYVLSESKFECWITLDGAST